MVTMDDISNAIILLVRVGAVARFVYCLVRLTAAEEQAAQYKKRARNTVIFYIIAESIWQIKDLILYYYSRDEQNSWKELPPNKANGNQKSLGHLKGAKTTAR